MLETKNIDEIISLLKEIKNQIKKRENISVKIDGNITYKQQLKYMHETPYINKRIAELEHNIHCIIVDCYIAEPFDNDYYGERIFYPDAFHTLGIKYFLKIPEIVKNKINKDKKEIKENETKNF